MLHEIVRRSVAEAALDEYRQWVICESDFDREAMVSSYWTDCGVMRVSDGAAWCGVFALWCLKQAGLADGVKWKIGLGFIAPLRLQLTMAPDIGDVIYYDRLQHHAIIDTIGDDEVWAINGNAPGILRARVKIDSRPHYFSITPLIEQAFSS